jgi:hypothetical protein
MREHANDAPGWKNLELGTQPRFPSAPPPRTQAVPISPTEEMLAAGGITAEQYRAMLAVAPKITEAGP